MTPAERAELEDLARQVVRPKVTFTPLTPLETPDRGWCDPCALPSSLSWQFAVEAGGHLFDGKFTTLTVCTGCGAETWSQ